MENSYRQTHRRDEACAYALWTTTCITLMLALMTWAGAGFGVQLTYAVFIWALLIGVLVIRRWVRRAPIQHYGAVIEHRSQPVVYHLSMFALLSFATIFATGAMFAWVASLPAATG